jgi:16S rRNA (adenine1518-N6/adenine1519-N6)-dimethyltransferase
VTRVRAKKRLGQHFLHDPAVIRRLVDTIRPQRADVMVEIGGGPGALTVPLAAKLDRLHVVEVDRELAAALPARVEHPERLVVHEADALAFDFGALATGERSLRVVGNLPYNISTPLLFHLLKHVAAIDDMHVMLQREV